MTLEELRSEIHDMLRGSIDAANLRNRGENLDCVNDSIESILAECRTSLSPTAAEESTGVEAWKKCGREGAEQHRHRVLCGSIGLKGEWSDWEDGIRPAVYGNVQIEYRCKATAEESTGVEVRDSCRDDARSAGRE